jgi:cyclohexyl-isocyanide hydratase
MTRRIGMLIFPRLTQLDMTGPYEVLARLPDTKVELVARTMEPVTTDRGMQIVPTVTYETCPPLDVVMVPGGPGQQDLMEDEEALAFLRKQAAGAQFITSVCTGSLVLAAADLLKGKRATCHWAAIDNLALMGAIPVRERVVVDGNVVTGAGVVSISPSGSPPCWMANKLREKSSCRSSMTPIRRSIPVRPRPQVRKHWRPCRPGLPDSAPSAARSLAA